MEIHNPLMNINLSIHALKIHFVFLEQLVLLGLVDLGTGLGVVDFSQSISDNVPFQTRDAEPVAGSSHIRFGHGLSKAIRNWKTRFFERWTGQRLLLGGFLLVPASGFSIQ